MRSYWFDNLEGDQRGEHDSGRHLPHDYLSKLGVLYYHCPRLADVDKIAKERSYKNRDEIVVSPDMMGTMYDEKVKMFFHEHLHEDEEIRYVMDGEGFFDVRDLDNEWVRIYLEKNDLIILPAGIFHRFTTNTKDYIKAMRLFKDEPKWTPLNRASGLENNSYRKAYLQDRNPAAGMMT